MATTSNRNAGASSPPQQGGGSIFRPLESPSSDWLGPLILNAKTLAAGVEILPFPYVQGVFKMVVSLLETVERVKKNRESLKELCGSAVDIIKILRDQISSHGDTAAVRLKDQCEEFEGFLQDVVHAAEEMQKKKPRFQGPYQGGREVNQHYR
ncbi:hypothetical protein C8F04DRAFT_1351731 [Mycena alexandri]|uniref:Uncharacterized protein n=1 Tax=Mycena alexandri TaxID=1745969 RepID=A0AAD6SUK1_9AGAR|nr:hypothetical protein C8F04DRAFT_1351731 [Mycena alexandri]